MTSNEEQNDLKDNERYAYTALSAPTQIASAGILKGSRAAMMTIVTKDGMTQAPGMLVRYRTSQGKEQELSILVPNGESLIGLITHALALILDDQGIDAVLQYAMEQGIEMKSDETRRPAVREVEDMSTADMREEKSPNA